MQLFTFDIYTFGSYTFDTLYINLYIYYNIYISYKYSSNLKNLNVESE